MKKKKPELEDWDIKLSKLDKDAGSLMALLSRKGTPRSAVDLEELARLSGLSERAATRAFKSILDIGVKLAVTKQVRYYWPKDANRGKR
ncbi:MAG: hypothetical protein JW844_04695 [Candidatus Omnitrophica bacterium]|nr:hypothetical protein [Candidatus Omnitrophota bacterium]